LGNKCDLTDQKVISKEEGEEIASQNGMLFYETSAKTGEGIKEAFDAIARDIIKDIDTMSNTKDTKGGKASGFKNKIPNRAELEEEEK
jgi:GTPase SAR1 family protein